MITRDLDSFADGSSAPKMPDGAVAVECKHALSRSRLPGLDFALNPYVGCGHDCVYCYAPFLLNKPRELWSRPIGARINMPRLLDRDLRGVSGVIGIGTVTDPYQPIEAPLRLTRRCLEAIHRRGARVSIHTKSDLVLRDMGILKRIPEAEVGITLTTIDADLAKAFEPFAPAPAVRLEAIRLLVKAGIRTYVLIGPIIPTVTDSEVEGLASAISGTGVGMAMLDRFRIRPGMMDYLAGREALRTSQGRAFFERLSDRDYCLTAEESLAKSLRRNGVAVEQAF